MSSNTELRTRASALFSILINTYSWRVLSDESLKQLPKLHRIVSQLPIRCESISAMMEAADCCRLPPVQASSNGELRGELRWRR